MSSEADAGNAGPGGPSPKTPDAAELGTLFGRFRLLDKIGSGDVSEVFRATVVGVQGFERRVAIKLMRPDVAEVEVGRLFAEEARVSAMLDHPSVVQVYEFGIIESNPFIAMEYLRGKNLAQVLSSLRAVGEGLTPALAVFIAQKVAAALAHAHELEDDHGRSLGVVHRDVTPSNIMLVREGAVKLLDFGVSRVTRDLRLAVSRGGRPLPRSSAYLSPEEAQGRPVDKRTDVFSLGIVLWEMLTGRPLFAGKSDRATLANVARAEIPPPSRFAADVPEALDRIVQAALIREVERRYRSAEALAQDLDDVMQTLSSRHGDLAALLDRVAGNPHDSGPRTLAGEAPVRRPTPQPRRPVEKEEPTTRQMGDNTLAAILAREPRRRGGWSRVLAEPRALLVGAAGLVVGILIAAGLLTGSSGLTGPDPAAVEPPRPIPPPVAARPAPPPTRAALTPPICGSGDAGPCPAPLVEPPGPEPKRAEERTPRRTSRRSTGSRSTPGASSRKLPDRQPNPFGD